MKRKEGSPIEDFAGEEFFEALPELRALDRQALEVIVALAVYCHAMTTFPDRAPSPADMTPIYGKIVMEACRAYGRRLYLEHKRVVRLVVPLLAWLQKHDWTLVINHVAKTRDGHTFFTTMPVKHIVVPEGDGN